MQGLILRFQGVSHRLAADSPERATIEHILDQADEVLAEGATRSWRCACRWCTATT
jgi:hypothetical protein